MPPEAPTPLHDAVYNGDADAIRRLLAAGADVEETDADGYSPLHIAVHFGLPEVVDALLDGGADIHARGGPWQNPPLIIATEAGDGGMMRLLIRRGARDNQPGGTYRSALLCAVTRGNSEATRLLLESEADSPVNLYNSYSQTALLRAVMQNSLPLTHMLLKAGADPRLTDFHGHTAYFYALRKGYHLIANVLREAYARTNTPFPNNTLDLYEAVNTSNTPMLLQLLEVGTDTERGGRTHCTPLISAAEQRKPDMAAILLRAGADVNACTNAGETALHRAVIQKDTRTIKLLLEAGADPNRYNIYGSTPLLLAASRGWYEVAEALLKAGCNITHTNCQEQDALYVAIDSGHADLAHLILDSPQMKRCLQADKPALRVQMCRALDCAICHDDSELVRHMLRVGVSPNNLPGAEPVPLVSAAARSRKNIVGLLLRAGADIHARSGEEGYTALHCAASCVECDVMHLLLSHGADITTTDNRGCTPLHSAAACLHTGEPARLLLEAGADVNARSKDGSTPLIHGVMYECEGAVDTLLAAGAEPDAATEENYTTLTAATSWGYTELFHRLLALGADPHRLLADGRSLLHVFWGWEDDIFLKLLDLGLDPAALDHEGNSVLMHATCRASLLKRLLERGDAGDINHAANDGRTALHEAAFWSNADETIPLLLEHGANPLARDARGRLPLHRAARHSLRGVSELLKVSPDINDRDKRGNTPLHYACLCYYNKTETIEYLLEHGADARARNVDGETPLHLATEAELPEDTLELLLNHGADSEALNQRGENALRIAIRHGDHDTVECLRLHTEGVGPNPVTGKTELMVALTAKDDSHFRELVGDEYRQDELNAQNARTGETALHLAVPLGRSKLMPLLAAGANPNVADKAGRTPLHVAAAGNHPDAAELLLRAGARTTLRDVTGSTPVELAGGNAMRTLLNKAWS